MNARSVANLLILSFVICGAQASNATQRPLRKVQTFDGQVMRCENRTDTGRVGYRIKSQHGLIKNGNLEVTINLETLKCNEREGILGFEKSALEGRFVNSQNGFIEFSSLELVGYTPDFKVVKALPVNLDESEQSLTLVAPVSGFVGLLPRNLNALGERRVAMIAFLRGNARMGDARTGKVLEQALVPFGAYDVFLSESENTLAFASQLSGSLDPR